MSASTRREQLLDVTRDLVSERGFHDLSVEVVARRAGISRPIVYQHFGDLDGLLEAMLEREGAGALGQLEAVLAAGADRDFLGAFRAYLEAVAADPVRWRLVLLPPEGAPEKLRRQVRLGREGVVAALAAAIGPGFAGERSPDPTLTARLLSALAEEGARLLLIDPVDFPPERLVAQAAWLVGRLDLAAG